MCVSLGMGMCVQVTLEDRSRVGFLRTGVTGVCEQINVCAENPTQIRCKSSVCF